MKYVPAAPGHVNNRVLSSGGVVRREPLFGKATARPREANAAKKTVEGNIPDVVRRVNYCEETSSGEIQPCPAALLYRSRRGTCRALEFETMIVHDK